LTGLIFKNLLRAAVDHCFGFLDARCSEDREEARLI
jgi:hypothetical protein